MPEDNSIDMNDYLEIVNAVSIEPLLREFFDNESTVLQGLVRDYIISRYGSRDCKTKMRDIFYRMWAFVDGYNIAKGVFDFNNLKNITEDGIEWTYDDKVDLDILDDVIEARGYHDMASDGKGTPDKNAIKALDKTRSYCMNLITYEEYSARTLASKASAYFDGYFDCLNEKEK